MPYLLSLQIVAQGVLLGSRAYLLSGWNQMDGIIVFISLLDIVLVLVAGKGHRIFGVLRVIRLLRTLRPLR